MPKFLVTLEAHVELTGEIEAVDLNEATLQAQEGVLDKVRSYVYLDHPVIVKVSEEGAVPGTMSPDSPFKRVN